MTTQRDFGRAMTYERSVTWAQTPGWTVVDIPELVPAMMLANDSGNAEYAKLADVLLCNAGRQAIHELEDVRRVSEKLFPRHLPPLANLAYAGVCLEAGHAGGDFYDFFDRGPHRLSFVVGDVSGKGMASALVRATLQASLRTLYSVGVQDLAQSLAMVNRLLFDSTPEAMYATLFLADYDENTRRLRYVNSGHPAPLLYGRNGVSRLETTSQVLGLFSDWKGSTGEIQLEAGETLLAYTDGISEATDDCGEEFGEGRLLAMLGEQDLPLSVLLKQCVQEVCRFGAGAQRDDLTLVALRGLEI